MHAANRAYDQGLKLSSQGRHLEAISCFEKALAERPDDTRTLFALGNTARALGLAEQPAQGGHAGQVAVVLDDVDVGSAELAVDAVHPRGVDGASSGAGAFMSLWLLSA